MHVIIDTREQTPWTFEGQGITTTRAKLETGDYSLPGLEHRVTIERKSLDDWTGTVLRDRIRFYKELERLRAFEFRCVIIEASVREIMQAKYKSQAKPSSVLGFVAEVCVSQSVPVYLAGSRAEAQILAGAMLKMAHKKIKPGQFDLNHPQD
jgi:ERCC4-type nuclease